MVEASMVRPLRILKRALADVLERAGDRIRRAHFRWIRPRRQFKTGPGTWIIPPGAHSVRIDLGGHDFTSRVLFEMNANGEYEVKAERRDRGPQARQ